MFRREASYSAVLLIVVLLCSSVAGQEVEDLIRKADEYYRTYHIAPGRFEQAIALYEQALAMKPTAYYLLWRLSEFFQIYGQILGPEDKQRKIAAWEKGLAYGKKAIEVHPQGKEGHFYYMANMGALAQLKGTLFSIWNVRTIKREIDKTLELDPSYPPALVAKAQFITEFPRALGGGDEQEAMALYRRAIEIDPDYLIPYYFMAQLDAKNKRFDEAVAKLKKIIECERPRDYAHWVVKERPDAERLLKEVRMRAQQEGRR